MSEQIRDYYEDVEEDTAGLDAEDITLERETGGLGEVSPEEGEILEVRGKSAQSDDEMGALTDADLAEAESLSVSFKANERQRLEDELAAFFAKGGKVQEVPPDESQHF